MYGQEDKKTVSKRRWIYIGPVAALCACLIIALIAVPAAFSKRDRSVQPAGDSETFETFTDRDQVAARMKELIDAESGGHGVDLFASDSLAVAENAEASDSDSAVPKGTDAAESRTYTQVQNVDEADIIKTDGNNIYCVSSGETSRICIYDAQGERVERISEIRLDRADQRFTELYVHDDRLVCIVEAEPMLMIAEDDVIVENYLQSAESSDEIEVHVYDISDPSAPAELDSYRQSGYMVSSRMVDGTVYLVTDYYVRAYEDDAIVPRCGTDRNGVDELQADRIGCFPASSIPEYVVVGAVDTASGQWVSADTSAVMGASDDIYCTSDTLYVASREYDYDDDGEAVTSTLLKIDISEDKVTFKSSGRVNGYIDDQWAMDEKDGYLRVATTSYNDDTTENNLFILDDSMKQVGQVSGFAKDEHIEAVRYIADKAYVITYEETDPLFILDLQDPKHPKIEGDVEITGFSTLLVPLTNDTLLGIGYSDVATDGLKLVIFDIGDPSHPQVIDSKELAGYYSDAQIDHRALVVNDDAGYFAIPYEQWDFDHSEEGAYTYDPAGGAIIFRTAGGRIDISDIHEVDGATDVSRCAYIGDYMYLLSQNGDKLLPFRVEL